MLKDKIRQIRTEKHLSQSELARQSGHAVSTIHGIENGNNKNPGLEMAGDIAKVLGIPLDELYQECKEDPTKQIDQSLLTCAMMKSPDYICMSEVRGKKTLYAALSGHPTMSTIHVENEEDFQKRLHNQLSKE